MNSHNGEDVNNEPCPGCSVCAPGDCYAKDDVPDQTPILRKQIEILEKRVRHVDVEIAQARASIDSWKGKLERERRVWSAFVERHGLGAAWTEYTND